MPAQGARDLIGRAWIAVGVRNDTRKGLDQIEGEFRRRANRGVGGHGGRTPRRKSDGGAFGAFGASHQIGFALEDFAIVYGQTEKISMPRRASANNLAMMSLALGCGKAQMAAVAAIVAFSLLPALLKMAGATVDVRKALEFDKNLINRGKTLRNLEMEREFALEDATKLSGTEAADSRLHAIGRERRKIEEVDQPALAAEMQSIEALRDSLQRQVDEQGELAKILDVRTSNPLMAFHFDALEARGNQILSAVQGADSAAEQLKLLNAELAAKRTEQLANAEKLKTFDLEEQVIGVHRSKLQANENLENRLKAFGEAAAALEDMTDPNAAQRRGIESDREERRRLLEDSGLDPEKLQAALGLNDRVADLQIRRLQLERSGAGEKELLTGLQGGTLAAAQQFERNRSRQHDPDVKELMEIKELARDHLDELRALNGNTKDF